MMPGGVPAVAEALTVGLFQQRVVQHGVMVISRIGGLLSPISIPLIVIVLNFILAGSGPIVKRPDTVFQEHEGQDNHEDNGHSDSYLCIQRNSVLFGHKGY